MRLPVPAGSYAVLIGTSTYRNAGLAGLPAVRHNLHDLAAVLTDPGLSGLPADHCVVVPDPAGIRTVYRELQRHAARATDTLIVYFAGHGLTGPRNDLFLSLTDTDTDELPVSALAYDLVRDVIRDSPARNRVVILDCCFSGRAAGDMAGEDAIGGQMGIEGTYVLAATSATAVALAPPGARHTAFTGELLELLRTGVPEGPELLTFGTIYRHLLHTMTSRGLPLPRQRGTGTADLLALTRNPAHVPAELVPAQATLDAEIAAGPAEATHRADTSTAPAETLAAPATTGGEIQVPAAPAMTSGKVKAPATPTTTTAEVQTPAAATVTTAEVQVPAAPAITSTEVPAAAVVPDRAGPASRRRIWQFAAVAGAAGCTVLATLVWSSASWQGMPWADLWPVALVQGLTWNLPVSIHAHLTLAEHLLGLKRQDRTVLLPAINFAATAAAFAYVAVDVRWALRATAGDPLRRRGRSTDTRLGWILLLGAGATVAWTAVMSSLRLSSNLWGIAVGLAVTAIVLGLAHTLGSHQREMSAFTTRDGAVICAAGLAAWFLPGLSPMGTALAAALALGFTRLAALRLTLLFELVSNLSVQLYFLRDDWDFSRTSTGPATSQMLVLVLIAFAISYAVIAWLFWYLRRRLFDAFVIYLLLLAGAVCAALATGVISAT